jgi:protein-tyrosine phosphatase
MGFVDLHSHVLPAVDDGARELADGVEMVGLLGRLGFTLVHATPHQKVGSFVPSREQIDAAHARLTAALPPGAPEVALGAENMWDELFLERSLQRAGGPLPVMAHPERYAPLWDNKPRYERLGQRAALVVDLGALDGAHGAKQCKIARWLCAEGLAHAAASDVHSPADVKVAASGIAWIRKKLGEAAVVRLLDSGPRQILNGELPV